MAATVVVVGSCMVDLVSYAPRLPNAGETLIGDKFQRGFGGKGANQCVSAARLGAKTALVAKVGDDSFGREYVEALGKEGVDTQHVGLMAGNHTGMAQIVVAQNGENQIVIVPGANNSLSPKDVQAAATVIEAASVLVFQLETPLETTVEALLLAKGKATRIVNAAPAHSSIDRRLYTESDIFCVNEIEAEQLSGVPVATIQDAFQAIEKFLCLGCRVVIITLGAQGAAFASKESRTPQHVACPQVQAVDTTGAGDAFLGALAFYIAHLPNLPLQEAIRRSCQIASVAVQAPGTQASFPRQTQLPKDLF